MNDHQREPSSEADCVFLSYDCFFLFMNILTMVYYKPSNKYQGQTIITDIIYMYNSCTKPTEGV